MAYTWTNKTKTGGIGLTGKIVQKGKDDFPLMYANDLDWANVEVENGVNLNTTDDLLNYIKEGNRTITGRIDELELSNSGYEIRCDKSVCYAGDIVGLGYQDQKLPVSIYKNGTLLSWTDAYTEGITWDSNNFTKPSGGNDLIHWSTSDCYLSGTANKAGTYIFNFKKNGVSIASYTLTVLLSPYKSTLVVVYTSSNTGSTDAPLRPTGGRYDFNALDNNLQDVEPWQTSVEGLSGVIWFCTGYVSQETPDNIAWGEPNLYLSKIGTPGTNWKITTLSEGNILVPVMYARSGLATSSPNDDCLTISPNYIRSYKLENQSSLANDSWRIQRNGEAYFAKGQAVFNNTGAFHIGGQNGQTHAVEANGTTSLITDGYIDYNPISGMLQIGGLNVSITGVDYALIGVNVTNSLSGDQQFIGLVANQAGLSVIGDLNTKDLSVGNGACFFKGDDYSADTDHGRTYPVGSAGAGHLANGNIWWDSVGNLHAKGLMTNRCVYVPGNNDNQTVVLDGNNLHSVTLAPMEHRMVVLPTYNDFTDPVNGWFVKGYKEDGTVINIKTESCDNFSNWSMIDEEAWFDGDNWTNTADLFKHCTLVCADPATLCIGGGNSGSLPIHSWKGADPTTPCSVSAEFKDNAMLNTVEDVDFPYYDGRFCARGAYSRFILLPPGQSLTLVSSIQKINVGTEQNPNIKEYLVWNIENASEFSFIKMGIVDRLNNSDVFDENNGLMESYHGENGIGDGLLSYKYMSLNYYTKENAQQGITEPDINKSIYIYLHEADADSNEDYPGNIIKPSWETAVNSGKRYAANYSGNGEGVSDYKISRYL